jgi:hypothetical protein
MATASAERTREDQMRSRVGSSPVSHESTCTRCGGLMVSDFCMDLLSSTGELEFAAKRCVQCGEVVDPVIQRNRRFRQESMVVRFAESTFTNNCAVEGP